MATSSTTVDVSSFTTDAKFRTWGAAVSAAILAAGLTQTSDTGQINWTTVARPTAATTKAGYEIWRFNDTLQSTKPIFMRIDYGSSTNSSGQNPCTWLTVGTGTDGAGTITGVGFPVTQAGATATASSNASMVVGAAYSTAAGACTILAGLAMQSTSHAGLWVVSRTTDSSGVPTGDGVTVSHSSSAGNPATRGAAFSPPTQYASTTGAICGVPYFAASVSSGGSVQFFKNYAWLGVLFPIMGQLSYYTSDVVALTPFTAAPFGTTTRTYLPLGTTHANGYSSNASANIITAVIWE